MKNMRRIIISTVLVFAMIITAFGTLKTVSAKAGEKEFIHVLYRTTGGELKAIWKMEVEPGQGTEIKSDLMKDFDPEGIIGDIDDLRDIKGIIVLKYRPDRDSDSAPADLEAFIKTLSKEDTFQTSNAFANQWTFDDPSGEMSWGGSLLLQADTNYAVQKITIKNAPKTLKVGKSIKLKAVIEPADATTKTLKWSVSNKKYAKITKNGKLTALKAGKGKTIKVTAKATDGSECKVTIKIKIKG